MPQLILLLIVFVTLIVSPPVSHAQADPFADLPDCYFTAASPDPNIEIGALIYNIETGAGCAENLDILFPVASVPKIFVAAALFDWMLESNVIDFNTELTFSERYWMGGRGDCLNGAALNSKVTLGELSDTMIGCSDNAATWMIMDAMGWERVDQYIDSTGIDGISTVIPYSEVDRQKLIFMDQRWATVPIAMASRFYRSEMQTGLDTYFDEPPQYTIQDEIDANKAYFDSSVYNAVTPRAMGEYMLKLAADAPRTDNAGQVARWVFNTMLLTPRQFTAQAIPGTITVGAKNGWDMGLRAEVNVMFANLPERQRNPNAISIIFARQKSFDVSNLQPPTPNESGAINQYLLQLAPTISRLLYPNYVESEVAYTRQISTAVVNPKIVMDICWNPYAERGFLFEYRGQLENCWFNQQQTRVVPGDQIGVGLILQYLGERDTRITFVYTDPNGMKRSYQTERFFQNSAAVYWFHPIPPGMIGTWTVDVYINRVRVFTRDVEVQSLF